MCIFTSPVAPLYIAPLLCIQMKVDILSILESLMYINQKDVCHVSNIWYLLYLHWLYLTQVPQLVSPDMITIASRVYAS